MLVSYYLPGNRSAPPPAHLVHGPTGHTEEEQSPFDPLPYGQWVGGGAMKVTKISVKWAPVWPVGGRRSNEIYHAYIVQRIGPGLTSVMLQEIYLSTKIFVEEQSSPLPTHLSSQHVPGEGTLLVLSFLVPPSSPPLYLYLCRPVSHELKPVKQQF